MKYLTQRAMYYYFAIGELEPSGVGLWQPVAKLFGVPAEEQALGERLLSNRMLACLRTLRDVSLMQKCEGELAANFSCEKPDEEVLELKYQALLEIKRLTERVGTTPSKAVAARYRDDPSAAAVYAVQILLRNKSRSDLGYRLLSDALLTAQSSDAGILLLNAGQGDRADVFLKLSETPDMVLHPDVLEELAKANGIDPSALGKRDKRMGF